jgi:Tfp pilus assembly protein PilE
MKSKQTGFTIVELLTSIIVLANLAVAILAFATIVHFISKFW